MPCPTCDHTLELVGPCSTGEKIYHCPRCGTMRVVYPAPMPDLDDDTTATCVPKLVGRCRSFRADLRTAEEVLGYGPPGTISTIWNRLGIAESITTPEDRS